MDRTDIGTLLIPDVQLSDAGTYMCVGSNSVGSNSAPIKVTVLKGGMFAFPTSAWQPRRISRVVGALAQCCSWTHAWRIQADC